MPTVKIKTGARVFTRVLMLLHVKEFKGAFVVAPTQDAFVLPLPCQHFDILREAAHSVTVQSNFSSSHL